MTEQREFTLDESQMQIKKNWPWNKTKSIDSTDINSIQIFTTQGFASDAKILIKEKNEIMIKLRWKKQLEELKQFSIKNRINCTIEELYHGGDIQTIYPE